MKTKLIPILLLTAILAAACAPAVSGGGDTQLRSVSVNGEGAVTLTPDMATISIGVQTEGANAERAMNDNNAQIQDVLDALAGFDIEDQDIQTTNFSIWPRSEHSPAGEVTRTYYVVNNTVMVTVRNLDDLGAVLNAVVESGANTISGIRFDVADRESAYAEALAAAMTNAHDRAETLAAAANAELGEVYTISSSVSGGGIEIPFERAVVADVAFAQSVPVAAGELTITVYVSVVYELK